VGIVGVAAIIAESVHFLFDLVAEDATPDDLWKLPLIALIAFVSGAIMQYIDSKAKLEEFLEEGLEFVDEYEEEAYSLEIERPIALVEQVVATVAVEKMGWLPIAIEERHYVSKFLIPTKLSKFLLGVAVYLEESPKGSTYLYVYTSSFTWNHFLVKRILLKNMERMEQFLIEEFDG
jgi:hypothetical protein